MHYLQASIFESLRLFSSVLFDCSTPSTTTSYSKRFPWEKAIRWLIIRMPWSNWKLPRASSTYNSSKKGGWIRMAILSCRIHSIFLSSMVAQGSVTAKAWCLFRWNMLRWLWFPCLYCNDLLSIRLWELQGTFKSWLHTRRAIFPSSLEKKRKRRTPRNFVFEVWHREWIAFSILFVFNKKYDLKRSNICHSLNHDSITM